LRGFLFSAGYHLSDPPGRKACGCQNGFEKASAINEKVMPADQEIMPQKGNQLPEQANSVITIFLRK